MPISLHHLRAGGASRWAVRQDGEWAGLASVYVLAGNRTPIEVRPEPHLDRGSLDYSVGRSVGKRMTSRIVSRPVSSMESLSMPRPRPAAGGIP